MNETLLWLAYLTSGAAAFAAVHKGWRIVPAMLAGAFITALIWYGLFLVTPVDERPEWITMDLSLNACFGLIFAGAGAAIAFALRSRGSE